MKPQDKPFTIPADSIEQPKLFIVVDDKKFPRPALETYFADYPEYVPKTDDGCSCHPVVGVYCQCNKVKVCSCVGYVGCSCDSHSSSRSGCRCAPVH